MQVNNEWTYELPPSLPVESYLEISLVSDSILIFYDEIVSLLTFNFMIADLWLFTSSAISNIHEFIRRGGHN